MAELFPLPIEIPMPHTGHEAHLCVAQAVGYIQTNLDEYKELVKDAKHVCKNCGRTAKSAASLCDPETL